MIQDLFDALSSVARNTRKDYHLTLGQLIDLLKQVEDQTAPVYLAGPHSYRGYYEDLALEPLDRPIPVAQLLEQLICALNAEFSGYKGGEYLMTEDTPLWVAFYGNTGQALTAFDPRTVTFTFKDIQ